VVRRARWQVPVVLAFAGAVWAFLSVEAIRHGYFDLSVYRGAIRYWAAGHDIYGYLRPNASYGYTYPPFAALAMLPLAVVGWQPAILLSLALNLVSTAVVLYLLVDPIARRHGWTRWFTLAIAGGLAAAYEPMHETISFGQVNLVLVLLVLGDLLLLVAPGRRLAGVGIGLATAVKLTPAVFVVYLLVTRRFRAAAVAVAAATAATVLAAAVVPDASRVFWTDAVWNTDRIGSTSYVSNQSLQGVVARLHLGTPWSSLLWGVLAVTVIAVWVLRVRRAAGDEPTGFTLTAIAGCLVSPFTWVHHLVWIMPAFPLLVAGALGAAGRRRVALLAGAAVGYAVLCSGLVWHLDRQETVWQQLGADSYALVCLALLVWLPSPAQSARVEGEPDGRQLDLATGQVRPDRAVGDEPAPFVEPPGPLVAVERP
jgi:alpha-1,2-mannosyltransferase